MPPLTKDVIKFGSFVVTNQVFHTTPHTFCLVNLRPLLPGHILISPRRIVPRLHDLTSVEISDLFQTVTLVSKTLERVYQATAFNIAIQDGEDAGQSVPHVHAHVIPRVKNDLEEQGGTDAIYGMMEGEEGDLGRQMRERDGDGGKDEGSGSGSGRRGRFPRVDADEERKPRSEEEMQREAEWLAEEMAKDASS